MDYQTTREQTAMLVAQLLVALQTDPFAVRPHDTYVKLDLLLGLYRADTPQENVPLSVGIPSKEISLPMRYSVLQHVLREMRKAHQMACLLSTPSVEQCVVEAFRHVDDLLLWWETGKLGRYCPMCQDVVLHNKCTLCDFATV